MWRSLVLVLLVLAEVPTANAQRGELGRALKVEEDPHGCLSKPLLHARVRRWLAASTPLRGLEIVVHSGAEPLAFTLRRRGELVAERRFERLPERCVERIDAVALAIALALEHALGRKGKRKGQGARRGAATEREAPQLEPLARADELQDEPDAQPADARAAAAREDQAQDPIAQVDEEDAEPTTAAELPDPAPPASEQSETPWRFFAHAGGIALLGALPEPVLGFGAGSELQQGELRLGLTFIATLESERVLGRGTTYAQLFAGRVHACKLWIAPAVELETCAGAAAGAAAASGEGYDEDMHSTMGWLAPLLRAGLRWPTDETLSLRVTLEGMVNLVRPRLLQVGSSARQDSAGPVAASAGLELLVAIP